MTNLVSRILAHLQAIYPEADNQALAKELLIALDLNEYAATPTPHANRWDESDIALITYGDTLRREDDQQQLVEPPLESLRHFLNERLRDEVSIVHVLPFFPYSSDDGFAVMDYTTVNPAVGDWNNILALSSNYRVMADLVLNHCSSRSLWFDNYRKGLHPGKDFFIEADPESDYSAVVRPRTSPLLKEVETPGGTRHLWCTFSHDQLDLNFRNPDVLIEFTRILKLYLDKGVNFFRLDAVAFLWKQLGTRCINLSQTHEIIRLLRLMLEHKDPGAVIVTETNIPNRENLTYFGNANEAHLIYNFSLPPLLVNSLVSGNCRHLKTWLMSMPPAQMGTTYFNFIASHDGIGLRPTEGLLDEWELNNLLQTMQRFGGKVSYRKDAEKGAIPYEINISLFDALKGTHAHGPDQWQMARFLCAHTIMVALEGIPAIYIHSFLGTQNDEHKVANTGQLRSINRHVWDIDHLNSLLNSHESHHAIVFGALKKRLNIRKKQPAFHPNATQFTLHLGEHLFAFWRQSMDRRQSIFAIHNVSDEPQILALAEINLISTDVWVDLISGRQFEDLTGTVELQPYQCLWLSNVMAEQCPVPNRQTM